MASALRGTPLYGDCGYALISRQGCEKTRTLEAIQAERMALENISTQLSALRQIQERMDRRIKNVETLCMRANSQHRSRHDWEELAWLYGHQHNSAKEHETQDFADEPTEAPAATGYKRGFSIAEKYHHARAQRRRLHDAMTHHYFEKSFGLLVLLNAVIIGVEVETSTCHVGCQAETSSPRFMYISILFCVLYVTESLVRLIALGSQFHKGEDSLWNVFDLVMAIISVAEIAILYVADTNDVFLAQLAKVIKSARLARLMRLMRFSPHLRTISLMILESSKQLIWLLIMLAIFWYFFAVSFTIAATSHLRNDDPSRTLYTTSDQLGAYFGSLSNSTYSCFKAMVGGQDWHEFVEPLAATGPIYTFMFLFYIVFAILIVMNVITGVFVDAALEKSKSDRNLIIEHQMQAKKESIQTLRDIFAATDTDGSGNISYEEFWEEFKKPRVQAYFHALKLDMTNIPALFQELDQDGNGEIDLEEFVENLNALISSKDYAVQLQHIINDIRVMKKEINALFLTKKKKLIPETNIWKDASGGSGKSQRSTGRILVATGSGRKSMAESEKVIPEDDDADCDAGIDMHTDANMALKPGQSLCDRHISDSTDPSKDMLLPDGMDFTCSFQPDVVDSSLLPPPLG